MTTWSKFIEEEKKEEYFVKLMDYVNSLYASRTIYPKKENIFRFFDETPFDKVKVVILGQDPYHNPNQAQGLAFSVPEGMKMPPSLVNIFKELNSDLNIDIPSSGSLVKWAQEGVLLMNAILTVEENKPAWRDRV